MNPFIAALRGRLNRRRQLAQLRQLDDHLLADIGLTRDDLYRARRSAQRPDRNADR